MRNSLVVAKKDFDSYFYSWTGVLVFVFFFLMTGTFFVLLVLNYSSLSFDAAKKGYESVRGLGLTRFIFSSFFINVGSLLIFLVPLLSMRSFTEERKMQTLELLYTYPLKDFEIVWGKYLGMVGFFILLMLPTTAYIGVVYWLKGTIDWGPVLIGYLGFFLLGCSYLSLGLFISSLTESQVLSGVASFACLIVFWIFDWVVTFVDGFWARFFAVLSPLSHYKEFSMGMLDLSNLVYFAFFFFYFMFLSIRSIETRNWKG